MGISKIKDICQKQDGFIAIRLAFKIIATLGPILEIQLSLVKLCKWAYLLRDVAWNLSLMKNKHLQIKPYLCNNGRILSKFDT